jgi:hypothetical protein
MDTMDYIPSGKRLHNLHNYGKSPFFMGKSTSITLLVGGLEHVLSFHILGRVTPTD